MGKPVGEYYSAIERKAYLTDQQGGWSLKKREIISPVKSKERRACRGCQGLEMGHKRAASTLAWRAWSPAPVRGQHQVLVTRALERWEQEDQNLMQLDQEAT